MFNCVASGPHLWCNLKDPTRAMSRNGITSVLKNLIMEAHSSLDEPSIRFLKVKIHPIRALGASLAFKESGSLASIMKVAFWRSRSVFASHYLKDVSVTYDNCFALSPVSVADTVLGSL